MYKNSVKIQLFFLLTEIINGEKALIFPYPNITLSIPRFVTVCGGGRFGDFVKMTG